MPGTNRPLQDPSIYKVCRGISDYGNGQGAKARYAQVVCKGTWPGQHRKVAESVFVCKEKTVATFEISSKRCIDPEGNISGDPPAFAGDRDTMVRLYRLMALTRKFDEKAVALQRTGQLGTFASSLGEEASAVAIGAAMRSDDVLLPSFREQGAMFARGVTPTELFYYWCGDERGSDFSGPRQDFPICVPVGSQASHAAGVGLAFKLRDEKRVAICTFGDGATSKGDVYEAMNVVGVWKLPVLFVVLNNQWAISVPVKAQTGAATLAQKAIATGFEGVQVDGNDVVAVHAVVLEALEFCRTGGGPVLIQTLTYRLTDHTTADDASRYRENEKVSRYWQDDPLARCRNYLTRHFNWPRRLEQEMTASVSKEVNTAAQNYLDSAPQAPSTMFDYLYASLPPALSRQRESLGAGTVGVSAGSDDD